jgi:putative hydrolase of the HAD superfamily
VTARAGIDAVLVDSGGVLLLPDPGAMRRTLAPLGAQPDDATCHRAHYAGMRAVDRLGTPDWPKVDRVVAKEAGVADDRLDDAVGPISDLYRQDPWVAIEGAAHALIALQQVGYPLAVVSNAEGTMEEQLARHRICAVEGGEVAEVAVVVDSAVVGIEKPDPRIFDFALDLIDADPARCVYLGDSVYFDVGGARAAGLQPVHVDPFELCDAPADHAHVASLAAFAEELLAS